MKLLTLAALVAAVTLTGCDHAKPKTAAAPGQYAFDVTVKLSPKAEAAMKTSPDGFVVDAWYYGLAKPQSRDKADQLNRIFLGDESWNFSANARKMHLHGEPIDATLLTQTVDGRPWVNLTVESVAGDPANPLKCKPFIGPVSGAQQATPVLTCEFETEPYWETAATSPAG